MSQPDSLIEGTPLESCTVGEFVNVLASDAILPGAGSAAGIALALAAACAGKAVAITLAHQNDKSRSSESLEILKTQLTELTDTALKLARDDAIQFKRKMESGNKVNKKRDLLETDKEMMNCCRKLKILLDKNESLIVRNMKGDWLAARSLSNACQDINSENLHELEDSLTVSE
jgi:hypothetical protein